MGTACKLGGKEVEASRHGHSFCAACRELQQHGKLRWQQSENNNVQGTRRGQAPNTCAQS